MSESPPSYPPPVPLPSGEGRAGPGGGVGFRKLLLDRRLIWLLLAAASLHSIVPAKMLMADWRGGMIPGMAILILIGMAIVWLAAVWGLVAAAALFPRTGVRAVALALLLLPYPLELSLLGDTIGAVPRLFDDPKTGRGYFDSPIDRELGGAIWACDWRNRSGGAACDLDKIAALSAKTDTAKVSSEGVSHMWWAISNGAEPDVLRIVLKGGKPPEDVSSWLLDKACCDSSALPLLRAALDGGVDPNAKLQDGNPYLLNAFRWPEGLAAYLDAGARVDEPDRDGYTPLMRALVWRQYDAAALLIAHGAAEDRVAPDGKTLAALVAAIAPEDSARMPPAVRALVDRHRQN